MTDTVAPSTTLAAGTAAFNAAITALEATIPSLQQQLAAAIAMGSVGPAVKPVLTTAQSNGDILCIPTDPNGSGSTAMTVGTVPAQLVLASVTGIGYVVERASAGTQNDAQVLTLSIKWSKTGVADNTLNYLFFTHGGTIDYWAPFTNAFAGPNALTLASATVAPGVRGSVVMLLSQDPTPRTTKWHITTQNGTNSYAPVHFDAHDEIVTFLPYETQNLITITNVELDNIGDTIIVNTSNGKTDIYGANPNLQGFPLYQGNTGAYQHATSITCASSASPPATITQTQPTPYAPQ